VAVLKSLSQLFQHLFDPRRLDSNDAGGDLAKTITLVWQTAGMSEEWLGDDSCGVRA
jgi:hypothetical protein